MRERRRPIMTLWVNYAFYKQTPDIEIYVRIVVHLFPSEQITETGSLLRAYSSQFAGSTVQLNIRTQYYRALHSTSATFLSEPLQCLHDECEKSKSVDKTTKKQYEKGIMKKWSESYVCVNSTS
jgi:hypothetical protein